MRRGTFLLVMGVGVPVVLLAAGWWLSSTREVEGRRREAMALLHRTAEVVRGVLDASLEEMRLREDGRPFDAYNHVYNPPGVVALGDALALSPLARDPEDPRVVSYFQIDAGDAVRTPYEKDALARRHTRARLVASRIETPAFAELRALAHAKGDKVASLDDGDGDGDGDENPKPQSIAAYNTLQNQIYEELQQKEIEPEKLADLALSKKIPVTTRNDVPWGEGTRQEKKAPTVVQQANKQQKTRAATSSTDLAAQAVVDYTPFAFDLFGEELVLYRLVSSGGSRSVQGALLDRAQIFDRWMPTVLERHSVPSTRPRVVRAGEVTSCSLRTPASDILEGLELCFPPDALVDVKGVPAPELGLLFALVVVVASAIYVTDAAARRADELARERGAFISAVSHELRTPLTTLRMHAELLRDGLVSEEKRRKFHDDMVQESVRLSHLVENVLEATRLEEGRRLLRASHGDLGAVVRGIASSQAPFIQTKGYAVEVRADDEVPCTFDRQAVEQIVVNLIDNAVKYAAEANDKTVLVDVRAAPGDNSRADGKQGGAILRVLDRGPGIPSEELEKVFQRFHRVQRPGQDHIVGTGLGLALVRELAVAHGGTARALPRDGGGCCVEVRLPAV